MMGVTRLRGDVLVGGDVTIEGTAVVSGFDLVDELTSLRELVKAQAARLEVLETRATLGS